MPPPLSPVRGTNNRVTIGSYGEVNYNNYRDSSVQDQIDLRRFVVFCAYRFDQRIKFASELEFEHAFFESGEGHGELAMEQA